MYRRIPPPRGHWPLRPRKRARRLRHRARGEALGRGEPCRRREGTRGARESRASRCRGGRSEHRRRRWDPGTDPRRIPSGRGRRRRAATAWPLRRRRLLPDPGSRAPRARRAADRADDRGRGPARDLVARRADRRATCGRDGPAVGTGHPAGADRGLGQDSGSGRVRAQAVRDPPRDRARRRARPGAAELLEPHDDLQGDADRASASPVLHRSQRPACCESARARPFAILDEHVPELGARAPVPDDRPQRRGQHAARQRQLDARARVAARLRAVRRRPAEGAAGRARRRL